MSNMMNLLERMMAGKDLHQPLVYHISSLVIALQCDKYSCTICIFSVNDTSKLRQKKRKFSH